MPREQQIKKAKEKRAEIPRLDQDNAQKYSEYYNKGRKLEKFEKNDLVLLKNSEQGKGVQKFLGPFRVVKRVNDLTYVIRITLGEDGHGDDTVHLRRLMRYQTRKNAIQPPLVESEVENTSEEDEPTPLPKKKRGRPKKIVEDEGKLPEKPKRPVGRPRKITVSYTHLTLPTIYSV